MNTPKRILVVATNRIGDVLLSTPLICSLRHTWPEAVIDVLVYAGTEGVLAANSDINEIIIIERRPALLRHLRFMRGLWRGYDLSLSLMTSDRPTLYASIASKRSVGLVEAGRQPWKKWLLSQSLPFDNTNTHTVLMHLKLADLLGIPRCHKVVATWCAEDDAAVRKALPFDSDAQAYAVLHVYPKYVYKAWRREAWVELAGWLNAQGMRVVLTGGEDEDEVAYVRELSGLLPPDTVDVAGKLSLTSTACLLSKARIYVGPDTVVTHLAAALGIPTIALFGPSNPVKWGPWPSGYAENRNPYRMKGTQRVNNVVLLQCVDDCVPCMQEGCGRDTASLSDCLQELPAARVITALQGMSPEAAPRRLRKIAVVVPKYGLVGGGERFASEITGRLARNENFDIHVFANQWVSNSDRITFHKIQIVHFPRFLGPLFFAWLVQRKISRMNFDLVHTHHWIFHADIYSAHGIPHAGWVRGVRNRRFSLYDRAMIYIERCLMKSGASSYFLPVSSIAMDAFRQEYTPLPGQWQIVHPGVDVARFSSPDRNACRTEIRGRYGIGADDLLILFVGMNFEVKGLDTIMAALAKARAAKPEAKIRLLVVGRGNKKKYGKIAESLGIADAVTFTGTQHAGLERFYRAADMFTLFSAFDTFGMVVLEAMAAGLPVIVSPNVGAKDLVEEGINGFVLPDFRDADAAADRIVWLSDEGRRESMGAAATRTASMHDWEKLAEKIGGMYDAIS